MTAEIISETQLPAAAPIVRVEALGNYRPEVRYGYETGDKYWGGFGSTELTIPDYWTLRARSGQLFEKNLFARGIVRRLVTNEIVTGLQVESIPNEALLKIEEDSLADWAEDVENRFALWGEDPFLCDSTEQATFGALQAQARLEALVAGDVLVTLQAAPGTRIPRIRLIRGDAVRTPVLGDWAPGTGNRVEHGVELDAQGRHVAFWVQQRDGSSQRLPAWGPKSRRRLAWLVYGTDRRAGEVRGRPLLSLILQSLSELDRYRDAELRKAYLNSILSIWVEKAEAGVGSRAIGNSGLGPQLAEDGVSVVQAGPTREFKSAEFIPGLVIEELAPGEKIHAHNAYQAVAGYGDFEAAITQGMSWALEIPPEILRLSFDKSFAASRAAEINFSMYVEKARTNFGEQFCTPIYVEWLLAETLMGNVLAPGLLESWRNPAQYVTFGAFTASDWTGAIKPSVDPGKQAGAIQTLLEMGLTTYARAAREING